MSAEELQKAEEEANKSGNFQNTVAGRAAFIQWYAKKVGIDPKFALDVAKSEGLFSRLKSQGSYVDRDANGPFSFWDYQLNYHRGVGVEAGKAGIDPNNPDHWMKADIFALDWIKKHGMRDWSGDAAYRAYGGQVPGYNGPPPADITPTPAPVAPVTPPPTPVPSDPPQAVSGLKPGEYVGHDSTGRRLVIGADGYASGYLDPPTLQGTNWESQADKISTASLSGPSTPSWMPHIDADWLHDTFSMPHAEAATLPQAEHTFNQNVTMKIDGATDPSIVAHQVASRINRSATDLTTQFKGAVQ